MLEEIVKELKWYERIIVRMYKRLFIYVYKKGVRSGFNWNWKL